MNHFVKICFVILFCQRSLSAPRKPRLSLAENYAPTYFFENIDGIRGTYSFSYDIRDPVTGNIQFRSEERYPNGTVIGSYGYVDASGSPKNFRYISDERGYRVFQDKPKKIYTIQTTAEPFRAPDQTIEPSITWTRPVNTNKKKPSNVPIYKRPQKYNLTGPPSSHIEY